MQVLLPANRIPIGSTVTMRSGSKPYTLRDSLTIYGHNSRPNQVIKAHDGGVFLVDASGNAGAYSGDKELLWDVSEADLLEWLNISLEGTPQ